MVRVGLRRVLRSQVVIPKASLLKNLFTLGSLFLLTRRLAAVE